jgi:hypothetical protein
MTTELTLSELSEQRIALLPARETLFLNFNWANIVASNSALAVNAAALLSSATAAAVQTIAVSQS